MVKQKNRESYTKKQLLDIYYNKKELCSHIWIENKVDVKMFQAVHARLLELSSDPSIATIVHFNSLGGSLNTGISISNLFKGYAKPLIGVVEINCMSAATGPFLNCDLRIFKPYVFFLIHQASYCLP